IRTLLGFEAAAISSLLEQGRGEVTLIVVAVFIADACFRNSFGPKDPERDTVRSALADRLRPWWLEPGLKLREQRSAFGSGLRLRLVGLRRSLLNGQTPKATRQSLPHHGVTVARRAVRG